MSTIDYGAFNNLYRDAFYRLMPKGQVWPVDSVQTPGWDALLDALAQEPSRFHADALRFIESYIPAPDMGWDLLDEWEQELGLSSEGLKNSERVLQILAKLRGNTKGPTLQALQEAAELINPTAVVQHQLARPARCGQAFCGDQDSAECGGNEAWLWTVWVSYEAPHSPLLERVLRNIAQVPVYFVFTLVIPPELILDNQPAVGTQGIYVGTQPMVIS